MKILFLTTAHNSLSQRLFVELVARAHTVTVEYALSANLMIEAAKLAEPDLIICPFLTTLVPEEVYEKYLTLIIHPGAPGDAGPSALDWVIIGDNGSEPDAKRLLKTLDQTASPRGRSHWGVTVLQAIKEFDAGPVWAFEQFPVDIDDQATTKSSLYRGPVTRAAVNAALAAIDRIEQAASSEQQKIGPLLQANPTYKTLSVLSQEPFLGGTTHARPLLTASQRQFDINRHAAKDISRRIRCADSQPGCLSNIFGPNLYLYGGIVEEGPGVCGDNTAPGTVLGRRDEAVCIATCDNKGIWITHIRRLKLKTDPSLWPKVPAVSGLTELGILSPALSTVPLLDDAWAKAPYSTFQEVWVDYAEHDGARLAYVYFDFYNGAMSTEQCSKLISALDSVLLTHTAQNPLTAVVFMGGSYFSNGIHLNVIDVAASPALESWLNINRIDDVVYYLLHEFPSRGILTVAGIRGNCAAGGVALATACDLVISGSEVVLNPAYRALGLYGSEYHSLSYTGRCGPAGAVKVLRSMTPLGAGEAHKVGLVDHVIPGFGSALTTGIQDHVKSVVLSLKGAGESQDLGNIGFWKNNVDVSPNGLSAARTAELGEMAKDFWSARCGRFHSRRGDFVRKKKPEATPLRFATHRRGDGQLDEEEADPFDDVKAFESKGLKTIETQVRKKVIGGLVGMLEGGDINSKINGDGGPIFSCYYTQ